MIDVYKIGLDLYSDVDKNGGLYEYNLIKNATKEIKVNNDILLIINGKKSFYDMQCINAIWNNYNIHIFVITDAVALNDELANRCDYVLHQSIRNLPNITKPQYYSYIPELFYNPYHDNIVSFTKKADLVFFGGGIRDNKDIFAYLDEINLPTYLITKTDNGEDNRINYDECQKLMGTCKFALILSRHSYNDIGFVTPRFIEAVNNWCVPIVLDSYDADNIFNIEKVKLEEVRAFYNKYKNDMIECSKLLRKYRNILEKRSNGFANLLLKIDEEWLNDKSKNS